MEGSSRRLSGLPLIARLQQADIEYYLFFAIIEFGDALNIGSSNPVFYALAQVGIVFLAIKLILTKYTLPELLTVVALSMLGILLYLNTGKAGGVLSILALIGMKGVDLKKLFTLSFSIRLTAFLLLISLSSFGFIENSTITNLRGEDVIVRYSMGFSHPNQFHLAFIILLLLILYLYYEYLGGLSLFILGILNLLTYTKSFSRTSTLVGFLAIALFLWFRNEYYPRLKKFVCMGMIPLGLLISILPALLYDKIPHMWEIDRILQWRVTFSRHYLDTYPITLFGNNLQNDNYILDSGYVELLVNYGLIFTLLYLAAFTIIILRYTRKNMFRELLFIICVSIYGITEAFIPNLFINLPMLFIGGLIYKKENK